MPELVEAEAFRSFTEKLLSNKRIKGAQLCDGGDPRVFGDTAEELIFEWLVNKVIYRCQRKGKYIWFELDRAPHVVFHLGMTGSFDVKLPAENKDLQPISLHLQRYSSKKGAWPPKFWKLQLFMEDGTIFAYVNIRRLGKVFFRNDPSNEEPISKLGPDALLDKISAEVFHNKLHAKRSTIKEALMNQSIFSGIGNWISDEILYQSRVHPKTLCSDISEADMEVIKRNLDEILVIACDASGDSKLFPKEWLFHYRWVNSTKGRKAATDYYGHPIKFLLVGGRTAVFVPRYQNLIVGAMPPLKKSRTKKELRYKPEKVKADDCASRAERNGEAKCNKASKVSSSQ